MLLSLALIFFCAIILSEVVQRLKLPGLLGMLITGIVLSPYALDLIAPEILNLSADLRRIALAAILIRAGLSLDIRDLKHVGRPVLLMCFIPPTIEIIATVIFAPLFFELTHLEAALIGVILAAVSPAIIVPRMIKLMENKYGTNKSIPQLLMTATAINGVYVLVLFTSLMGMTSGNDFDFMSLAKIPIALITGFLLGVLCGLILVWLFEKIQIDDTVKVLIILGASFLLISLETLLTTIPISGLIAVVVLGSTILKKQSFLAEGLAKKYSNIWIPVEILLFVLVGATVNMTVVIRDGGAAIILIFMVLMMRFLGVLICLAKTSLNKKEKLFCGIAYLPKATVQAAIGAIPLVAGVEAGNIILTVAVCAILTTAPLGALGIDALHKKMLTKY